MNQQEFNQYVAILKNNKAKMTPQRLEILRLFLSDKTRHFTAEDVIEKLAAETAGQATVYRTLELFSKLGILKKVNFNNEEFIQYDLVDINKKHFHHHLICDHCHKVIESDDDLFDNVEAIFAKRYGFKVLDHELVVRGVCKECIKEHVHV